MTEITDQPDATVPARPTYAVDPVAFILGLFGTLAPFAAPALILAGLDIAGVFTDPIIPIAIITLVLAFAVAFGGPIFLTIGAVTLYLLLRRGDTDPHDIAGNAILVNLALMVLAGVLGGLAGNLEFVGYAVSAGLFGLLVAPLWGWLFGWIYRRLARDFYTQTLT